jgi:hypothetical protein
MTPDLLKETGIRIVAENNRKWKETGLDAVRQLAVRGVPFTTDEVREMYKAQPKSPNAWGALVSLAARQGLIRRVGYRPSEGKLAHSRVVSVWEGNI